MSLNKIESFVVIDDIWNKNYESLPKGCSSKWLLIPEDTILYGVFQFIYFTNRSMNELKTNIAPDFVCFDAKKCPSLASDMVPTGIINGLTCVYLSHLVEISKMSTINELIEYFYPLGQQCLGFGIDKSCPNSSYFYCNKSSKCILYHRVGDGKKDCFYNEDELFDACQLNDSNRLICKSDPIKCLMPVAVGNGFFECTLGEDEVLTYTQNVNRLVPLSLLCDYQLDSMMFLDGSKDTDETNCHWWPCHNPYTRCNGLWNCPNGIDELNCPNTSCSFNQYECQLEQSDVFYCLSREHIYEEYISNCNNTDNHYRYLYFFNGTNNITEDYFSWNNSECISENTLCRDCHHAQISIQQTNDCLYRSKLSVLWWFSNVRLIQNKQNLCKLDFAKQSSRSISSAPFF